jgi:hypothetical protein
MQHLNQFERLAGIGRFSPRGVFACGQIGFEAGAGLWEATPEDDG